MLLFEIWPQKTRSVMIGIDSIGFPIGIFSSGLINVLRKRLALRLPYRHSTSSDRDRIADPAKRVGVLEDIERQARIIAHRRQGR